MVALADITLLARDGRDIKGISGDTVTASNVPSYTVAALPTPDAGKFPVAFATNGCAFTGAVGGGGTTMTREGAGTGTGCLVSWNGTAWKIVGTSVTVTA